MDLNVVLTMAGRGNRFARAGSALPKAATPAAGRPLLWWAVASLRDVAGPRSRVVFIVRAEDDVDDLVAKVCADHAIEDPAIVRLPETTDGQATTVLRGLDALGGDDRKFVVYNTDTHVRPGALDKADFEGDGWIPCFPAEGDAWSFVAVDDQGGATAVAEKRRISGNATVGLYGFPSPARYRELYERAYDRGEVPLVNGERYVAPMYDLALRLGWTVGVTMLDPADVVPLGTPDEVAANEGRLA